MNPDEVRAIMNATYTYRVEICHPRSDWWNHIHPPDWETSTSYPDAWTYAITVRRDHPGSDVRLVETDELDVDRYIPLT